MADVLVIGGGVMGLAVARELSHRGQRVTLLERAQTGRAASWASAGIIGATVRDESDPTYHLRRISREMWPGFAAELRAESGLDPEYREIGCLHLALNEGELAWLENIYAREAGKSELALLDRRAVHAMEPALSSDVLGAVHAPGGNVENRRLCRALEIAARRAGVDVRTGVEVRGLEVHGQTVRGLETNVGALRADTVILAAGAWSSTIAGVEPHVPVRPQRGQILALDQSRVGLEHVLMTSEDPYFVPRADGRLVIGATREDAGWDASLTAGGVASLLNRAMAVVPALVDAPILELWTGFRPLSEDGLPLIGPSRVDGLYLLTGHGPSGIAPLPGSVALLCALVAGEQPPISPEPFSPLRFGR